MIVRSIDDEYLERFLKDYEFLFKRIRSENGELDLRLRNNYFNLYYKGNSLAKVRVEKVPYQITVHGKFAHEGLGKITNAKAKNPYQTYSVSPDRLRSFFSKANIRKLSAAIKSIHYSEELTLEQMLITDNLEREDFFIIDRQVQGGALGGGRIDLLALRQVPGQETDYQFLIIEIKLGNNPELYDKVGVQLKGYREAFEANFNEFKKCYERTYIQMKQTGVFSFPAVGTIDIVRPVSACVVVFGYSGMADNALKSLLRKYPDLLVTQLRLKISSVIN